MTQYCRAQVSIPHNTGLPEDAVVNTWHYITAGSAGTVDLDAAEFETRLETFYAAWVPTAASAQYDWENITVKHYNFGDPPPRLPFRLSTIDAGAANASAYDLPAEVAICLSMKGAIASGDNPRRMRGRVYLGPLVAYGPADVAVAPTGLVTLITNAADTVFSDDSGLNPRLAVYSPYTHHGVPVGTRLDPDVHPEVPANLAASFTEVVTMWVDNAFDTQRRRGPKPTVRTTVDVTT